ncbi:hypothetical protein C8N33_10144 [Pararhodobacter aggregans]|nr:hypothetical protein C8N33_10144 [Pararhodobacter aggregans]
MGFNAPLTFIFVLEVSSGVSKGGPRVPFGGGRGGLAPRTFRQAWIAPSPQASAASRTASE